jgi:hypothetical protein
MIIDLCSFVNIENSERLMEYNIVENVLINRGL